MHGFYFFYFILQRKVFHRISKSFDVCMNIFGFVNAFNILAHVDTSVSINFSLNSMTYLSLACTCG